MTRLGPPEPIDSDHVVDAFDCGEAALNRWLLDHALASHRAGTARTFVVGDGARVRGFYSVAAGAVMRGSAPTRVAKGGGAYPIPLAILARLAVDRQVQGQGIGAGLLRDALLRISRAGHEIGIRAVLVHIKNPALAAFYERFDFEPSPVDEDQMFLLMKDLRRALGVEHDRQI